MRNSDFFRRKTYSSISELRSQASSDVISKVFYGVIMLYSVCSIVFRVRIKVMKIMFNFNVTNNRI